MTLAEFRDICAEIYSVIEKNGKQSRKGFPQGCDQCQSTIDWDCYHVNPDGTDFICSWRENHWKYDEIRNYMVLINAQNGGLNLNRVQTLYYEDYVKIAELKKYYRNN